MGGDEGRAGGRRTGADRGVACARGLLATIGAVQVAIPIHSVIDRGRDVVIHVRVDERARVRAGAVHPGSEETDVKVEDEGEGTCSALIIALESRWSSLPLASEAEDKEAAEVYAVGVPTITLGLSAGLGTAEGRRGCLSTSEIPPRPTPRASENEDLVRTPCALLFPTTPAPLPDASAPILYAPSAPRPTPARHAALRARSITLPPAPARTHSSSAPPATPSNPTPPARPVHHGPPLVAVGRSAIVVVLVRPCQQRESDVGRARRLRCAKALQASVARAPDRPGPARAHIGKELPFTSVGAVEHAHGRACRRRWGRERRHCAVSLRPMRDGGMGAGWDSGREAKHRASPSAVVGGGGCGTCAVPSRTGAVAPGRAAAVDVEMASGYACSPGHAGAQRTVLVLSEAANMARRYSLPKQRGDAGEGAEEVRGKECGICACVVCMSAATARAVPSHAIASIASDLDPSSAFSTDADADASNDLPPAHARLVRVTWAPPRSI
ncbi:hypothetical protein DFH09DRAFT_1325137 [Mycena vulgaris]|nr:hypothetical protein DFH09DRAFT_1325137 [Mycena vulgaris]